MPSPPSNSTTAKPSRTPGVTFSVLANWAWYFVVLVVGFLLPRLIDTHQGQDLLGIWDLGWSLAMWISLLSLSVTAAVNRYVARYRTIGDWQALNESFNSCLVLLVLATALGVIAGVALARGLPYFVADGAPETIATGRWVVLLLSGSVAAEIVGGAFNGVITGHERYDVLNYIRITRDVLVFAVMAGLLLAGFGLVAVAATRFVGDALGNVVKLVMSRRICPSLRISLALSRRPIAMEMLGFGAKAAAQNLARAAMYQGNSLIVAHYLGLGVLAVYSRQRSLVMHMMRFIKQYAQVFIPRASVLQAKGDSESLRSLAVLSSRYALYATLPIVAGLLVTGGPLLEVWMGAEYKAPLVLIVLAIGHVVVGIHQTMFMIAMGTAQHARPAWFDLGTAIVSVAMGLLLVGWMNLGMMGAAIAVSIPNLIGGGILIPWHTCQTLELPFGRYLATVSAGPLCATVPLVILLVLVRIIFAGQPLKCLAISALGGATMLAVYSWLFVLPPATKKRISRGVFRAFGRKLVSE